MSEHEGTFPDAPNLPTGGSGYGFGGDPEQEGRIIQPRHAMVGNCRDCGRVLIVCDYGGSWPLVDCGCGWKGGITEILGAQMIQRREAAR